MVAASATNRSVYNMPTTIEFHGTLDEGKMRAAFGVLCARHGSLRTVVRLDPQTDEIMQHDLGLQALDKCFELVVHHVDCEEKARHVIERDSGYIFDLGAPPVVRGTLLYVADTNTTLLLIVQHHVCSDGWSRTQFRLQLLKAYLSLCEGKDDSGSEGIMDPTLGVPGQIEGAAQEYVQYMDWTDWQRRFLKDFGAEERQLAYWRSELADVPVLELPLDHPRPPVLSQRGARIDIAIPPALFQPFLRLLVAHNVNAFVGLLSLYFVVLGRFSGGKDFAVGVAMANRQHEGMAEALGYYANEVAIRGDLSGAPSFAAVLERVRTKVLNSMANADAPFHEVTEQLQLERSRSRTAVFQAMFALQERSWHSLDVVQPPAGSSLRFNLKKFEHHTAKFETHLQLRYDGKDGLEGDFYVATDLLERHPISHPIPSLAPFHPISPSLSHPIPLSSYLSFHLSSHLSSHLSPHSIPFLTQRTTGERIVQAYILAMESVIANSTSPINHLSLTPASDTKLRLMANRTTVDYGDRTLLSLIDNHPPHNVALAGGDRKVSFYELSEISYNLGEQLRGRGIESGQVRWQTILHHIRSSCHIGSSTSLHHIPPFLLLFTVLPLPPLPFPSLLPALPHTHEEFHRMRIEHAGLHAGRDHVCCARPPQDAGGPHQSHCRRCRLVLTSLTELKFRAGISR
jgi:hypothetical protein